MGHAVHSGARRRPLGMRRQNRRRQSWAALDGLSGEGQTLSQEATAGSVPPFRAVRLIDPLDQSERSILSQLVGRSFCAWFELDSVPDDDQVQR